VSVAGAQDVGNTKQLEAIQAAIEDHEPHPTTGQMMKGFATLPSSA
jgi:hypothetical protein